MSKSLSVTKKALAVCVCCLLSQANYGFTDASDPTFKEEKKISGTFTGRVIGKNVRLRTSPDLDGFILKELPKDELLVILEEKDEFFAVSPTDDIKAYIFRSFVLDNVVEGNRVNVRLAPDLDAPIINHLSTGKRIDGKICEKNTKWLEIAPPEGTKFYVAKEYIEYAGGPDLKEQTDKKIAAAVQLLDASNLLVQAEIRKPFEEIAKERIVKNYQTIINDYDEFPDFVQKAKEALFSFNEKYLERKIAYLEAKAANVTSANMSEETVSIGESDSIVETLISQETLSDRMKVWEPVEESLYLSWAAMHRAKTMDDFYLDQRLKSIVISGFLEAYIDPVKNRPGDYILKEKDLPMAYVYSTHVNLQSLIGKRVNLVVTPRPNNSFAFPAYYVLDAE